jgi:hypothetical protein
MLLIERGGSQRKQQFVGSASRQATASDKLHNVGAQTTVQGAAVSNGPVPVGLPVRMHQSTILQLVRAHRISESAVPINSVTHTFAAGPQFAYRRWRVITLYLRPSIGAIHEIATPKFTDPIESLVVTSLAPSGKKEDWTGFYGIGGGADLNFSKHVSIRVQTDIVHDHLFSDLLKDGRNTVRLSIGPAFQFGHNIAK